jgi:hypothetical protein
MRWTRAALTLGLAWLAFNLLLKGRREEPPDGDDGLAPFPSVDSSLTRGSVAAAVGGGPVPVTSGAANASALGDRASGADSPNDAERLAAAGSANAGAESAGGDLFGSDSQQGPYPRAPGPFML